MTSTEKIRCRATYRITHNHTIKCYIKIIRISLCYNQEPSFNMSDKSSMRNGPQKYGWNIGHTKELSFQQATINSPSLPAPTPPLPINQTKSPQQTSTVEWSWPVQIGQLKLQAQQRSESSTSKSNGKSCESNIIDDGNGEKQSSYFTPRNNFDNYTGIHGGGGDHKT